MESLLKRQEQQNDWNADEYNFFGFIPNLGLALTYIIVFGILTMLHLALTIRSRVWWGSLAVLGGVCEIVGWAGRLGGHFSPYGMSYYLMQQVALVIAPVLWSATCYALMGKLIPVVGPQWSRFKPKTFIIFFIIVDIVCLILQGVGGSLCGIAGGNGDDALLKTGQSVYLAGISFQLFNTILFAVLTWDYFNRMKKDTKQSVKASAGNPVFKLYLGVMVVNLLIVFRNGFREAELSEGFNGKLATVEPYVACLDALPMVIAFCTLAYCHPYFTLQRIEPLVDQDGLLEKRSSENKV